MNRLSSAFLLRRAYEHLTASVAALALTALILMTVNAHAANPKLKPSVTIQVPTVEIEVVDDGSAPLTTARVNG